MTNFVYDSDDITNKRGARMSVLKVRLKQRFGFNFYDIFYMAFCAIFALICFYPLWFVFLGSIYPVTKAQSKMPMLIPNFIPTFEYYLAIFRDRSIQQSLGVSFLKTIIASVGSIVITSMMAYTVSKKIRGMKAINIFVIMAMYFSGGIIPTFLWYVNLGLYNNFWVMVIPFWLNTFNFILMRNYFNFSVPHDLEDASLIDGANEIILFFRIIFPISIPMLAALFLFEAVANWNDWVSYLFYVSDIKLMPMTMVLQNLIKRAYLFTGSTSSTTGSNPADQLNIIILPRSIIMTTIMISIVPIILAYPFLQKYFVKGILIGAIKE